jgi:HSP20 family protein
MELPSLFRRNREPRAVAHPLDALQREMSHLLEDFWGGFDAPATREWGAFSPRLDVEETDAEVRVTAELPGLDEKDVEVEIREDVLTLRGQKHAEREDKASGWRERSYGSFHRAVQLPSEVEAEKATAEFKKGVLTVHLPKSAKARERSRRVPVTAA